MGSGLDVPYPPEHAGLMRQMAENGAVISEYPLGTKPDARHFPRRNRLLSGLSLGTLVIEAPARSGTFSTIRSALEQNREVLCVPGSIYSPASALTNQMIREGAKLVMNAEDVLEELNLGAPTAHQSPLPGLDDTCPGDAPGWEAPPHRECTSVPAVQAAGRTGGREGEHLGCGGAGVEKSRGSGPMGGRRLNMTMTR